MDKLNFFGIGPKIGRVALPVFAVTIFLTLYYNGAFAYSGEGNKFLFYAGLALLILGVTMYLLTVPSLMKGLKNTRLITGGTYYLCCNPLYASIILFIIPGTSLIMNSWVILATSIVAYVLFKVSIRSEYDEMEKFFGDEYKKYRAETPDFLPFPFRKWFKSA